MPRLAPLTALVVTNLCPGVLTGCSDVIVEADVSYDPRFAAAKLDIYSQGTGTDRPAVLVIHGGGWRQGSRSDMADHARRFAEAGFVAVNIDYRLTPSGRFPHAVQDCVCALAYVRANAADLGIDPDRIATYGYSAGGHLATMLGMAAGHEAVAPDCEWGDTGPARAVVSGAGPQDMALLPEVDAVVDFVGGTRAAVPELYAAASPLSYVAAGAPPTLFITGDADWFVDIEHSRRMQRALEDVGVETRLLSIAGGGHLLNRGPSGATWEVELSIDTPEAWAATIDFLDRSLGGAR